MADNDLMAHLQSLNRSNSLINPIGCFIKATINGVLSVLGVRITRVAKQSPAGASKYFNTGRLTPIQENSVELYDQFYGDHSALEHYYDASRLAFFVAVSTHLLEKRVQLDGKDVLDVGCGTGHLMKELRSWAKPRSMTGCDFSKESIKFSFDRFPDCHFFQHDIYERLTESYDVIFCTEVLEHLERPFVAVRNLVDALRPGGIALITVPNGRYDKGNEHINFWSPESWKVFVERECLDCETATDTLMHGQYNCAVLRKASAPLQGLHDNDR